MRAAGLAALLALVLISLAVAPAVLGAGPDAGGAAPRLLAPANHMALAQLSSVDLAWESLPGARQHQVQIVPANGDAPALDVAVAGPAGYTFQAPDLEKGPYHMLPGSVYAWRVRSATNAGDDDGAWSPWSEVRTFSTPRATAETIKAREPQQGRTATGVAPALEWTDRNPHVFWYEVQLSVDPGFPPTPSAGNRAVYSNQVHGGVSVPVRSWRVPEGLYLEYEERYYWRVRPVVQGETPAEWSQAFSFGTPAAPPPPPDPEPVPLSPRQSALGTTAPRPNVASAPGGPSPAAPAPAAGTISQGGNHGAVLSLINQIRASNGLGGLSSNGQLAAAAQAHSSDMAARNSMSHTGSNGSDPSARLSATGYPWRMYGEVVAAGQTTPQAVVNAWMNSPSHRAVILTAGLREFGAGLAYSAAGRPYWTVDFGTR